MSEKLTAGIKAFMRPDKFKLCLKHILDTDIQKVIVAFDGDGKNERIHRRICKRYSKKYGKEVKFLRLYFNAGISRCRNAMADEVDTPYLLIVDDDMYVPPEIVKGCDYLDIHKEVDILGFCLWNNNHKNRDAWAFDIDMQAYSNGVYKSKKPNVIEQTGLPGGFFFMKYVDTVENCAIFRTSLFGTVRWDDQFVLGEHLDFYLNIKINHPEVYIAQCLNICYLHDFGEGIYKGQNNIKWGEWQTRKKELWNEKWGITEKDTHGLFYYHPTLRHCGKTYKLE